MYGADVRTGWFLVSEVWFLWYRTPQSRCLQSGSLSAIVDGNVDGTCRSGLLCWLPSCVFPNRCLQNYIPAHSLTLSCPVCRQTSILPEKGVAALQNNFFITNLMDVLQRTPGSNGEDSSILETVTAVAAGKPLSCPNHDGNVSEADSRLPGRGTWWLWPWVGFRYTPQRVFIKAKIINNILIKVWEMTN